MHAATRQRFILTGALVGGAVAALGYLLLLPHIQQVPWQLPNQLQDTLTLTLSIIVEALPFVVLGSVFSAVIQVFVSTRWLLGHLPKNGLSRRALISLFGAFMPACECGNVPVARSLIIKGLKPADSITFLLAAPIINPITITTTVVAFQFDPSMVWIRLIAGFVIANAIGALIATYRNQKSLLTQSFRAVCEAPEVTHTHRHKFADALEVFRAEAVLMLGMLCFGAVIAALSQVFVPREILTTVGSDPVLSILAMSLLAFIISICASMDAFFALAYANSFTFGAVASFLVFGPMVDIKMLALMKTTFRTRVLVIVSALVALGSVLTGLVVNYAL